MGKSMRLHFPGNHGMIHGKRKMRSSTMLFHYGRTFDINDLAVDPAYQRKGIAKKLMDQLLADIKAQGMVGAHLITAGEGALPAFYERYGFQKENRVILMGRDL